MLQKKRQCIAVFLSLTDQDKQGVRNTSVEDLFWDNKVKLDDKIYLKDESSFVYRDYEKREKFSRPSKMSINDYVIKFEQFHLIAKSHKMEA